MRGPRLPCTDLQPVVGVCLPLLLLVLLDARKGSRAARPFCWASQNNSIYCPKHAVIAQRYRFISGELYKISQAGLFRDTIFFYRPHVLHLRTIALGPLLIGAPCVAPGGWDKGSSRTTGCHPWFSACCEAAFAVFFLFFWSRTERVRSVILFGSLDRYGLS